LQAKLPAGWRKACTTELAKYKKETITVKAFKENEEQEIGQVTGKTRNGRWKVNGGNSYYANKLLVREEP